MIEILNFGSSCIAYTMATLYAPIHYLITLIDIIYHVAYIILLFILVLPNIIDYYCRQIFAPSKPKTIIQTSLISAAANKYEEETSGWFSYLFSWALEIGSMLFNFCLAVMAIACSLLHTAFFYLTCLYAEHKYIFATALFVILCVMVHIVEKIDKTKKQNNQEQLANSVSDNRLCTACKENESDTLLMPCNHLCLCAGCLERLKRSRLPSRINYCPVCRARIQEERRVYF